MGDFSSYGQVSMYQRVILTKRTIGCLQCPCFNNQLMHKGQQSTYQNRIKPKNMSAISEKDVNYVSHKYGLWFSECNKPTVKPVA